MKINVSIEANSVEEAQAAFAALAGNSNLVPLSGETNLGSLKALTEEGLLVYGAAEAQPLTTKEPEKPKNSRSKPKEAVQADPLASAPAVQAEPVASVDPLGAAPTTDPLGVAPVVQSDPLAASTPATATGDITFEQVRAKIGEVATHSRPKVMALVATYKKADGTPCERPSDLQEKDYAVIYADLDYV
jgi:hypothetical protein